ncbi:MAG: hypothetical protein GVY13_05360 [Alphaproteobacteria bacterium]|nr:hypothetical protein [Alphaproteobacteria bacterium]
MTRAAATLVVLFNVLLAACQPAAEGPACGDAGYHWSATEPAVNLRHIFCGDENRRGRAVGFHSTLALGQPAVPALVPGSREQDETPGIFSADIVFPDGQEKFSTFFPEACDESQILASVLHAASDARPVEPWGYAGPSAPADADPGAYCLAGGAPFAIRVGTLDDGRINTAFPQ